MKTKTVAYTDYPRLDSKDCVLRKIKVLKYDGNKYCDIQEILDDGSLGPVESIKLGYIKMRPELKGRPNTNTVRVWAGKKPLRHARVSKRDYFLVTKVKFITDDEPRASSYSTICHHKTGETRYFSSFKTALKEAEKLLTLQHRIYNTKPHLEIVDVCICTRGITNKMYWDGGPRTYIDLHNGKPSIAWMDRWNRYFREKKK